jgi:hypothetical protein
MSVGGSGRSAVILASPDSAPCMGPAAPAPKKTPSGGLLIHALPELQALHPVPASHMAATAVSIARTRKLAWGGCTGVIQGLLTSRSTCPLSPASSSPCWLCCAPGAAATSPTAGTLSPPWLAWPALLASVGAASPSSLARSRALVALLRWLPLLLLPRSQLLLLLVTSLLPLARAPSLWRRRQRPSYKPHC